MSELIELGASPVPAPAPAPALISSVASSAKTTGRRLLHKEGPSFTCHAWGFRAWSPDSRFEARVDTKLESSFEVCLKCVQEFHDGCNATRRYKLHRSKAWRDRQPSDYDQLDQLICCIHEVLPCIQKSQLHCTKMESKINKIAVHFGWVFDCLGTIFFSQPLERTAHLFHLITDMTPASAVVIGSRTCQIEEDISCLQSETFV